MKGSVAASQSKNICTLERVKEEASKGEEGGTGKWECIEATADSGATDTVASEKK